MSLEVDLPAPKSPKKWGRRCRLSMDGSAGLRRVLLLRKMRRCGALVTLLRARRRRRLEANGKPFESGPSERLTDDQIRYLSVADVLRMRRRRVAAPNE